MTEAVATEMPSPLNFTDSAAQKVKELITEENNPALMLRVFVSGGLRIDGKVHGDITAQGDGSTLILSERGEVTGNIKVPHLIINGTIKGNVHSSECVELQAKAEITGDMTYKSLEMALGATVNGGLIHEAEKGTPKLKAIGASDPVIS